LFPDTIINIEKLKGIGSYTAAAIASISFNLPHAAIDGNVYRVLSRVFGIETAIDSIIGKREFSDLANELLDRQNPGLFNEALMEFGALQCTPQNPDCQKCPFQDQCGLFNEALMEFGALQCTPQNPDCQKCPFQDQCIAFAHNIIGELPFKSKKTKVKNRFFNYLFIQQEGYFYLEKREENDIWRNLYQFPLIETTKTFTIEELLANEQFKSTFNGLEITIESISHEIIHVLTHQKLHVRFIDIIIAKPEIRLPWIKVHPKEINDFPVPKLIDNFLMAKA